MTDYFKRDGVSASLLKTCVKQSAAHAAWRQANPMDPTPAMKLGTATHAGVLQSEEAGDLIAVAPDVDRRTKSGKAEYAEWLDGVGDRLVITPEQSDLAWAMTQAVHAHPEASRLLADCYATEVEVFRDIDGLTCKAKVDAMDDAGTIVDLKTTTDASPEAFGRQCANLLYHLQLAWYSEVVGVGVGAASAFIIAVENSAPHAVAVYQLGRDTLDIGSRLCEVGLARWRHHLAAEALTGGGAPYGDEIMELELPAWAKETR